MFPRLVALIPFLIFSQDLVEYQEKILLFAFLLLRTICFLSITRGKIHEAQHEAGGSNIKRRAVRVVMLFQLIKATTFDWQESQNISQLLEE